MLNAIFGYLGTSGLFILEIDVYAICIDDFEFDQMKGNKKQPRCFGNDLPIFILNDSVNLKKR